MSAKRVPINQRRGQTSQTKSAIKPVGTDAIFDPESIVEAEEAEVTEPAKNQSKAKSEPTAQKKTDKKDNLVKTTVYIEEDNFLELESLQLKLKRKERRRVTKNELFNQAIELLVQHYSD